MATTVANDDLLAAPHQHLQQPAPASPASAHSASPSIHHNTTQRALANVLASSAASMSPSPLPHPPPGLSESPVGQSRSPSANGVSQTGHTEPQPGPNALPQSPGAQMSIQSLLAASHQPPSQESQQSVWSVNDLVVGNPASVGETVANGQVRLCQFLSRSLFRLKANHLHIFLPFVRVFLCFLYRVDMIRRRAASGDWRTRTRRSRTRRFAGRCSRM